MRACPMMKAPADIRGMVASMRRAISQDKKKPTAKPVMRPEEDMIDTPSFVPKAS